jgi:hypothetical protein
VFSRPSCSSILSNRHPGLRHKWMMIEAQINWTCIGLAALVVPAQHASAQLAQKKVLTLAPSLGTASCFGQGPLRANGLNRSRGRTLRRMTQRR